MSYIQNGNLGKVLQCLPFSSDVLHAAHNHHMLQLVIVEVGGSERHHEVPEADERTVGVSEETDNNVTIENSHGGLVPIQDTVLYSPGRDPVEHPSAVVLHLCLDEVEVPGLVVRDSHVQLAGHYPVCRLGVWPEGDIWISIY